MPNVQKCGPSGNGSASPADTFFEQLRRELPNIIREAVRAELRTPHPEAEAPLDTEQAAARLNISVRKLDELVSAGRLQPLRIGRKRLFPRTQLESFLRECAR